MPISTPLRRTTGVPTAMGAAVEDKVRQVAVWSANEKTFTARTFAKISRRVPGRLLCRAVVSHGQAAFEGIKKAKSSDASRSLKPCLPEVRVDQRRSRDAALDHQLQQQLAICPGRRRTAARSSTMTRKPATDGVPSRCNDLRRRPAHFLQIRARLTAPAIPYASCRIDPDRGCRRVEPRRQLARHGILRHPDADRPFLRIAAVHAVLWLTLIFSMMGVLNFAPPLSIWSARTSPTDHELARLLAGAGRRTSVVGVLGAVVNSMACVACTASGTCRSCSSLSAYLYHLRGGAAHLAGRQCRTKSCALTDRSSLSTAPPSDLPAS